MQRVEKKYLYSVGVLGDAAFMFVDPRTALADPATNEELGTVPEMGLEETKEAIEAASKAFPAWSRTTAKVSTIPVTPLAWF